MKYSIVLAAMTVCLSACGGGGSGSQFEPTVMPEVTPMSDPEPEPTPDLDTDDNTNTNSDSSMNTETETDMGTNTGTGGTHNTGDTTQPDVQPPSTQVPTFTSSFSTTIAPSARAITDYLRLHGSAGPHWQGDPDDPNSISVMVEPGLARFSTAPTVLLDSYVTERERALTHYAVSLINNSLPYDQHLRIDETTIPDALALGFGGFPQNSILVQWHSTVGATRTELDHDTAHDETRDRVEKRWIDAAIIRMYPSDYVPYRKDRFVARDLVHELLHALGFYTHVPNNVYPTTYLPHVWTNQSPLGKLNDIEAASVYAFYTRLGVGTAPEDVTATSLGSWTQDAATFAGRITSSGDVTNFGVTVHNGLIRPWMDSNRLHDSIPLSDNQSLSGTVTWDGGLVGVTPDQAYVQGLTSIDVDMGTLTGTASFTNLEFWNDMPQAVGTGTQWNTGSLEYDLSVSSMFLRSTGGDAGTVNGVFYGPDHNTVGGTLERADLTAAFGAARE